MINYADLLNRRDALIFREQQMHGTSVANNLRIDPALLGPVYERLRQQAYDYVREVEADIEVFRQTRTIEQIEDAWRRK